MKDAPVQSQSSGEDAPVETQCRDEEAAAKAVTTSSDGKTMYLTKWLVHPPFPGSYWVQINDIGRQVALDLAPLCNDQDWPDLESYTCVRNTGVWLWVLSLYDSIALDSTNCTWDVIYEVICMKW